MSHATVMVVLPAEPKSFVDAENMITDLMAPYDENTRVEPFENYYERPDDLTSKYVPYPYGFILKEKPEIINDNEAIADWLNERYGEDEEPWQVDENGLYQMSTYNPESKWDWWVIGGRWRGHYMVGQNTEGFFLGNNGGVFDAVATEGTVDVCCKNAIDKTETQRLAAERATESWTRAEEEMAAKKLTPEMQGYLYGIEMQGYLYGIKPNQTKTDYINSAIQSSWPPSHYAVLDGDGWHEPGQMGWFGHSSETDESKKEYKEWCKELWDNLSDDTWIACVDYHI